MGKKGSIWNWPEERTESVCSGSLWRGTRRCTTVRSPAASRSWSFSSPRGPGSMSMHTVGFVLPFENCVPKSRILWVSWIEHVNIGFFLYDKFTQVLICPNPILGTGTCLGTWKQCFDSVFTESEPGSRYFVETGSRSSLSLNTDPIRIRTKNLLWQNL